jgi:hypothetical protein
MTRRSGRERVTRQQEEAAAAPAPRSGLRQRSPLAYWVAILGAVAVIASTFASALSVFL